MTTGVESGTATRGRRDTDWVNFQEDTEGRQRERSLNLGRDWRKEENPEVRNVYDEGTDLVGIEPKDSERKFSQIVFSLPVYPPVLPSDN